MSAFGKEPISTSDRQILMEDLGILRDRMLLGRQVKILFDIQASQGGRYLILRRLSPTEMGQLEFDLNKLSKGVRKISVEKILPKLKESERLVVPFGEIRLASAARTAYANCVDMVVTLPTEFLTNLYQAGGQHLILSRTEFIPGFSADFANVAQLFSFLYEAGKGSNISDDQLVDLNLRGRFLSLITEAVIIFVIGHELYHLIQGCDVNKEQESLADVYGWLILSEFIDVIRSMPGISRDEKVLSSNAIPSSREILIMLYGNELLVEQDPHHLTFQERMSTFRFLEEFGFALDVEKLIAAGMRHK